MTSRTPLRKARSDAGMNTRFAIHSMSSPTAAIRKGSCDIAARTPKSCIISPPPIQMIAIDTWTKSRNEYQVTRPSLGPGLDDHHEGKCEQHEDHDPGQEDEAAHLGAELRARPLGGHAHADAVHRARDVTEERERDDGPADET